MTIVKAKTRWIRIAPRKLSRVLKTVKGKNALEALTLLKFMPQKGARILEKVLKAAVANAKNNYKLGEADLRVSEVYATSAVIMKRWAARARGRGTRIEKRTSHLTVCLEAKEEA
jgi:large subunit ribosomal protein L22